MAPKAPMQGTHGEAEGSAASFTAQLSKRLRLLHGFAYQTNLATICINRGLLLNAASGLLKLTLVAVT